MSTRLAVSMRLGSSLLPHAAAHLKCTGSVVSPVARPRSLSLSPRAPSRQSGISHPSRDYRTTSISTTSTGLVRRASARLSRQLQASAASTELETKPASPPQESGAATLLQGSPGQPGDDTWQVKLLYDGDCPICMREVDFLQKRNEKFGTLKFVDISAQDYDPEDNAGISFEEAMGHIHGIMRDGTIVTGVEAFRKFYEVIGLGWVYALTKLKPVQAAADAVYEVWAKYRLPLTGRPGLDAVLEERRRAKNGLKSCEEEEECEVEY